MEDVILRILNGNTEAFRLIVSEYYESIYYFVRKQVNRDEDSRDLTQEIFIKIYQNLSRFDGSKSSFKTWIYKIATNYCLDYFKSKVYRDLLKTESLNEEIGIDENIMDDRIKSETLNEIRRVMKTRLKKKHLRVMSLYYFAELTVNEISETLDIPVKTVYTILNSSINKIKIVMEDVYE